MAGVQLAKISSLTDKGYMATSWLAHLLPAFFLLHSIFIAGLPRQETRRQLLQNK